MTTNNLLLVTGAASGLGAAVTRLARQQDMQVLALDDQDQQGQALCAETGALYQHCDVGDPASWQQVAERVNELGAPQFVHLNAGIQIAPPEASLDDYQLEAMTLARYRKMMSVNVDGVVFGLQSLLPLLPDGASIVVTGSLAGITPYAVDPLYAMSKHAVTGIVRSLAPTLEKRNISINAICPGGIDTAIIPHAQRTDEAAFMTPANVAAEVMTLLQSPAETGKTWAKVSEEKPAFIVRAPGDRR